MEIKPVSYKEIDDLIQLSKDELHPYYYRFNYSKEKKSIIAKRIRKNRIFTPFERQSFLQIELEENDILAKSIDKINNIKEKIGAFTFGK